MTTVQTDLPPERRAAHGESWLTALERELRSRVGWVDEAVSPYAIRRKAGVRGKSRRASLPADKAA